MPEEEFIYLDSEGCSYHMKHLVGPFFLLDDHVDGLEIIEDQGSEFRNAQVLKRPRMIAPPKVDAKTIRGNEVELK